MSIYHRYVNNKSPRLDVGSLTQQQLLRSFFVSAFPDYFMSLGIDPEHNIELQVVSLPLQKQPLHPPTQCGDENNHVHAKDGEFILAGSITILPDTPRVQFETSDTFATIFHQYTGRTLNRIRLWVRDNFVISCYSVFNIPVDFRKTPEEWFMESKLTSWKEYDGHGQAPRYNLEHKRLTEKEDAGYYVIPGMCGKRFFWWRGSFPFGDSPTGSRCNMAIKLYSCDTDCLPLVIRQEPKEGRGHEESLTVEEEEAETENDMCQFDECMLYPGKVMKCPFVCQSFLFDGWGEENHDECVYSLLAEGYSGTIFLTLSCGDVLVLRYGHP